MFLLCSLLISVQNLASEPSTAVVFCSSSLYSKPMSVTGRAENSRDEKGPAAKREKLSFAAYLKRSLPPSCRILGLTADGIIGKCSHAHLHVRCEKCNWYYNMSCSSGTSITPVQVFNSSGLEQKVCNLSIIL